MSQMNATLEQKLICPECGEYLYSTTGQYATLWEHSQRNQVLFQDDVKENIRFNSERGFKLEANGPYTPKGEASINSAVNMAVSYSGEDRRCKNDGQYIVLKKVVIGATFKK